MTPVGDTHIYLAMLSVIVGQTPSMDDAALIILRILMAATIVLATIVLLWAFPYVRRVYRQRAEDVPELRRLYVKDRWALIATLLIGWPVAWSLGLLLGWIDDVLPWPWWGISLLLGLDMLLWGVVDDAISFWRYRNGRH